MNYDFNINWLIRKFTEIQQRLLEAMDQLDDEQLNWRPNSNSNSISNIIIHIKGNIQERIEKGMFHREIQREREQEFDCIVITKAELMEIVKEYMGLLIKTTNEISKEELDRKQFIRNRERTNLEILHQCTAHFSEHMGQVFYIAKLCLDDKYVSTSIPRNQ